MPHAYDLTQRVYDRLPTTQNESKRLYGYVVAKLLTRQSRLGRSPFEKLNVEQVYDALKRLLARESDALAEFVFSWDMIDSPARINFDPRGFVQDLSNAFSIRRGLSGPVIAADDWRISHAADRIAKALKPSNPRDLDYSLRPYLETLVECLRTDASEQSYLKTLVKFCAKNVAAVATLNYDTLVEQACTASSVSYDYGLSGWNNRKHIRFFGGDVKLIKLHGSVNWFEDGDDIVIDNEISRHGKRGLIFGGQGEKLVPHGPYLQLRHEFQSLLRNTNVFGIIGYSFRDRHLNAIIRSWASSRRKAKLVILDPGTPRLGSEVLSKYYTTNRDGKILKYHLEIEQISETASSGMRKLITALQKAPNPPTPDKVRVDKS